MTVDDISGGRLLCGLGTGGDLDSRILGDDLPLKERVDRFHEFVELLDRLFREDHVDHDGAHYGHRGRPHPARLPPAPAARRSSSPPTGRARCGSRRPTGRGG